MESYLKVVKLYFISPFGKVYALHLTHPDNSWSSGLPQFSVWGVKTWVKVKGRKEGVPLINNTSYKNKGE